MYKGCTIFPCIISDEVETFLFLNYQSIFLHFYSLNISHILVILNYFLLVFVLEQDINPWFQFGKDGFLTPPATAHKGSCSYSPERVICPLPLDCPHRLVPNLGAENEFVGHGVCDEMPIRTRLGPLVAPALPTKKKKKNGNGA